MGNKLAPDKFNEEALELSHKKKIAYFLHINLLKKKNNKLKKTIQSYIVTKKIYNFVIHENIEHNINIKFKELIAKWNLQKNKLYLGKSDILSKFQIEIFECSENEDSNIRFTQNYLINKYSNIHRNALYQLIDDTDPESITIFDNIYTDDIENSILRNYLALKDKEILPFNFRNFLNKCFYNRLINIGKILENTKNEFTKTPSNEFRRTLMKEKIYLISRENLIYENYGDVLNYLDDILKASDVLDSKKGNIINSRVIIHTGNSFKFYEKMLCPYR
jgi:hypothetical protein